MSLQPSSASIGLSPALFDAAFPFHFAFDRQLIIRQVGRSLHKLVPTANVGTRLGDQFVLRNEGHLDFDLLTADAARLMVFYANARTVTLRGQIMVVDSDTAVFLGSPWFTSIDEVARVGLQLTDFAIHDPIIDVLQAVQHTHMNLADIRDLASKLTARNEALSTAHAQLRSRQSEAHTLALIASRTDNAVILTDAEGLIRWVNQSFTRLTGYELQEVLGKKPGSILQGPESDPEVIARIRQSLSERRSVVAELVNYHKDGRQYWVHIEIQPIFEDGVFTGYMALETDVTEARQQRERAERLAHLNDIGRDIIASFLDQDDLNASINLVLGKIGRFLDVSRSYLFRYRDNGDWLYNTHEWCAEGIAPQKDQLQKMHGSLFPEWTETLRSAGIIRIDDVVNSNMPPSLRAILDPQGIRAILVIPMFIDNALQGFVGFDETRSPRRWLDEEVVILQTIVESLSRSIERRVAARKIEATAEQLAAALKKAELANSYKSEFLANMSHEIRTPMTAIVGFSEMILRTYPNRGELSDWARQIHRSSEHLLSVLNDILDLSKIESGKLELMKESCSPVAVIEQVHSLMLPAAKEKMLEFETFYDGPQPRFIHTDTVRLRQIILNLVSNAIKFTDTGRVCIRARLAPAEAGQPAALHVTVEDTGIGIPKDKVDEIFSPFVQIQSGNARRSGGTGLGLDICKRLSRLLGGSIHVRSDLGVGSEFTLSLPLHDGDLHVAPASELRPVKSAPTFTAPPNLAGRNVLVVDDNPENRKIIEFILRPTAAGVFVAVNGAEALDFYSRFTATGRSLDLILMDMQMPVLDGYSAAAELRKQGATVPIFALTAAAMAGDEQKCLNAGCTAFVSKPIIPGELYSAIARLMPTEHAAGFNSSSLLNDPEFRRLVDQFVQGLPFVRGEIAQKFKDRDFRATRSLVHQLAGTGSNFGFPAITASARACEKLITAEDAEAAGAIESLLSTIDSVVETYPSE